MACCNRHKHKKCQFQHLSQIPLPGILFIRYLYCNPKINRKKYTKLTNVSQNIGSNLFGVNGVLEYWSIVEVLDILPSTVEYKYPASGFYFVNQKSIMINPWASSFQNNQTTFTITLLLYRLSNSQKKFDCQMRFSKPLHAFVSFLVISIILRSIVPSKVARSFVVRSNQPIRPCRVTRKKFCKGRHRSRF